MYEIEMHEMTPAFHACWLAAGNHLNRQVDGGIQSWLRADPYPPFLEHLSFRLGNQLFFVRLVDVDGEVRGPGNPRGAISAARMANGIACELPMKRSRSGAWAADLPGWGLIDGHTGQPLNPAALVTDEKIEMTAWELQDIAVQIVRDDLTKAGFKLNSWQSNPEIDPSLWFVGKSGRPEWVVVRTVTYPVPRATVPANWEAIAANVARISELGHFASVSLVSADQINAPEDAPRIPLWRGHGLHAIYEGLDRMSQRL